MKKLKEILFLSDKGYTDLKKAIGAGWQDKKYNELGVVVRIGRASCRERV